MNTATKAVSLKEVLCSVFLQNEFMRLASLKYERVQNK